MFECLICGSDMREVVMDAAGRWQPDEEVHCPDCAALHRVESNDSDAWLVLLKSGAECAAAERIRLLELLQKSQRYMEHTAACRIDHMPDCRCTCGCVEVELEVQLELRSFLTEKLKAGRALADPHPGLD